MRLQDAFPSKYLRSEDLEEGDLVVTISDVRFEEFVDQRTKQTDNKPVIHFEGKDTKSMVLNKTNWRTIAGLLGSDDTDDWIGKKIALYATEVESFGEMVMGIRVRLKAPAKTAGPQKQANKPQAAQPRNVKPQSAPDDPFPESLAPEADQIPF